MKVSFFDKSVRRKFFDFLSVISILTSLIFIFVDIDTKCKSKVGFGALFILVCVYICIWLYANYCTTIKLKINASEIEVKFGDIFTEEADLRAIAFNEYFDTIVDDIIISKASLNGLYIAKFYEDKIPELDNALSSDAHLRQAIVNTATNRQLGKQKKYRLGTICVVNDYLLIAFSRFDGDNKAYLEINDYIDCLLNFWSEVDRVYAGRTVALPVLGSGITRFKGYENIYEQELLELIIWTFKVSRIKLTYPSKAKIVVYDKKKDKVNLLRLKDLEA